MKLVEFLIMENLPTNGTHLGIVELRNNVMSDFFSIKKRQIAPAPIQTPITKYHLNRIKPQMLIAKIESIPIKVSIEAKLVIDVEGNIIKK